MLKNPLTLEKKFKLPETEKNDQINNNKLNNLFEN